MTREEQDKLRRALYNAKFTTDAEDENPFVGIYFNDLLNIIHDFGQQHPNWTPVDERLPEERQVVWVRKHFKRKYVGEFDLYDSAAFCNGEFQCDASGNVTHWMEIQPPQGNEE